MRVMRIDEIHAVNLEILRHVKAFCQQHGIRWFLSDGTLIGAVREHGFIPWDDDVDITMPRPDYDRFIREYRDSPRFKLYAHERGNALLSYARLCEMERTVFKSTLPWTVESPGVGIDVFPIDGCSTDEKKHEENYWRIIRLRNRLLWWRTIMRKSGVRLNFAGFVKDIVHILMHSLLPFFSPYIRRLPARIRKLRLEYGFESSEYCFSALIDEPCRLKRWRREWFDTAIEWEFCGERFPIPVGYDGRLRTEYGDYMTPPPALSRTTHLAQQTMLWKV